MGRLEGKAAVILDTSAQKNMGAAAVPLFPLPAMKPS
jgi:hypothetical protein